MSKQFLYQKLDAVFQIGLLKSEQNSVVESWRRIEIGVPFYNTADENEFRKSLDAALNNAAKM